MGCEHFLIWTVFIYAHLSSVLNSRHLQYLTLERSQGEPLESSLGNAAGVSHKGSSFTRITPLFHFSGGYFANSLAIMTDAAHLLSDFAGFMISLLALWMATKPATTTLSFGWHRAGNEARV